MSSVKKLRQRWTPERAAEARDVLATKWMRHKRLERVAFGVHEGRLDLRGLAIFTNVAGVDSKRVSAGGVNRDYTFVTLDDPPEFHSVKWESIDFSFAELDHLRIFLSEITDCLFSAATVRDWRNWGNRYVNCDFSDADLRDSSIGGASHKGRGIEYVSCHWQEGKMSDALLSGATYCNCMFENVKLTDQQITEAAFMQCTFSGTLKDITVDGRIRESESPWAIRPDAAVDCDFSGCVFDGVRFLGIDARRLRLPTTGRPVPHISAVARRALAWAETADLQDNERSYLRMYWRGYVTQLPDDAEGWIDFDFLEGRARELVVAAAFGEFD